MFLKLIPMTRWSSSGACFVERMCTGNGDVGHAARGGATPVGTAARFSNPAAPLLHRMPSGPACGRVEVLRNVGAKSRASEQPTLTSRGQFCAARAQRTHSTQ